MPPKFKVREAAQDAIGAIILVAILPLALAIMANAEPALILLIGGAQ